MRSVAGMVLAAAAVSAALPLNVLAQQEPGSSSADDQLTTIAKEVQNPATPVMTLPIQSNFQSGLGPGRDTGAVFKLQPAIPIKLTDTTYLVSRTIIPIAHVPFSPRLARESWEVGNINETAWVVTPVSGTPFLVGLGPSITFPTFNSNAAGTRKTSLGPSGLLVFQQKDNPWVIGALVAQAWSVAGPGPGSVNVTTLQPFANYNLRDGWFLNTAPEIGYDWQAKGKKLLLPVGGGIGKAMLVAGMPVTQAVSGYYNAVRPDGAPRWVARLGVSFVFQ